MEEIVVALHMHTIYSDGHGKHADLAEAGLKAGLDAILITDHNLWVQDMEGYIHKGRKRLLTLVGEEVHDQSLKTGKNHLLILGNNRELARFAPNSQLLIDQAAASGGLTFIAHPIEDALPAFGEAAFNWENWEVSGFTGIELWNQMSEFKSRSATLPKAALHAIFPRFMMLGPLERTLKLWDDLLAHNRQPVVAVGGVDAHALKVHKGPLKLTLYPYELQFRSLTNHLLLPTPLTGELTQDKRLIYDALRQGHSFVGYDLPHSTRGFRFNVNSKDGQFVMGDHVSAEAGLTFQVRLPMRTHVRLIKDGKVIKEHMEREVLTHITKEPGIYRAEVYLDYLGRHRGWIFSNPIYAC
ncbi:MAG: CehA/McbA family metallohydrolase [Anaerolineaceae bacterium]